MIMIIIIINATCTSAIVPHPPRHDVCMTLWVPDRKGMARRLKVIMHGNYARKGNAGRKMC